MKMFLRNLLILCVTVLATHAFADDHGNKMVRMRMINIAPDVSGSPSVVGGDVAISNASVPEVDLSYFFTDKFALELILATAQHRVNALKTSSGTIDLGEVNLLPPTLLAQYHHSFDKLRAYVGAGINYTMFYDVNPGSVNSVRYDNAIGYAWQVGADYEIAKDLFLNLDVKKLKLATDVRVNSSGTIVKADVDIDPWIVGLGLGYRF